MQCFTPVAVDINISWTSNLYDMKVASINWTIIIMIEFNLDYLLLSNLETSLTRMTKVTLEEFVAVFSKAGAYFYHFTDTRNLPSIREHGILSMAELKKRSVETVPGGNQWSLDADKHFGMDEYVHVCFIRDHPMAYLAQQEGRIEHIKYLSIDPTVILQDGAMITDRVSNKRGAEPKAAREMFTKIDWEVLYTRTEWKDPAIQARLKIAKVCELLVPNHIPINLIKGI